MICVYPANCTDFSTNGKGTLAPLSAEVTETLNGEYELTLVHPIDEAGKLQRLVEGCILRAPVPAAMTPRVNFTTPGDDNRREVWRVNTDFSGTETRKGTLRLRSGPGTKYKVLATYKNGSFVQVIAKTNSSWYEVTAPDGKHGYMSTTYLMLDHTEDSASVATSSVVESRQLRNQSFRIYRVVPELDKITVYARHVFYDLLDNMIKSYKPSSSSYASSRMSRYKQDIANKAVVSDCIGGCKGYAWTNGGQGVLEAIGTDKSISSSYGSHECPDKGANSMFSWAKSKGMDWGTIDTLPEILGLALYKDGHAGYYIGNSYAVEWQGFSWGCVKTQVKKRPWTHWYKLPFIDYGDTSGAQVTVETVTVYTLGSKLLKNGSSGSDVKALQELLNQLGAALEVDGQFGSKTEAAVRAFQKKAEIKQDGKYDDQTHAALIAAVAEDDAGQQSMTETQPEPEQEQPVAGQTTIRVLIKSSGGKVNIRTGNGTSYSRITAVAPGTTLEYVASVFNGWQAVKIGSQVGWVSGEYSEITSE